MKKVNSLYERSRVPLYLQVASVMRQRIETGSWPEGEQIPTLEAFETEFGVARVTVRQAIEVLRKEGLLDARQGKGTFVLGRPKRNRWLNLTNDLGSVIASIRDNVIKRVHIEENVQLPALNADEGKPAGSYTFLRSIQYNQDEPFSTVNLFLAQHIFDRNREQFSHTAALPKIMELEDVKVAHAYQTVTIGVADPETAEQLEVGLGEPIAECHLILSDSHDVAIYVADIKYRKECFTLRVDLLSERHIG